MRKSKEEIKKTRREYYLKNKDTIKQKVKEWVAKNKDYKKIYNKEYAKKHKEKILLRVKEWRKNNQLRYVLARRKRENDPIYSQSASRIYKNIKSNCKQRKNRHVLISKEDFVDWLVKEKKVCCYCGVDENILHNFGIHRLQIERINNDLNYEKGNLALACVLCNKIKSNILTADEMKFIGENIVIKKWKNKLQ